MKQLIQRIPLLGPAARHVYRRWVNPFPGSEAYWKKRYEAGGHSGFGSYNELAEFKAEILNDFVREQGITSVIEFGCGDGNQLSLARYPRYLGFDVSPTAIALCERRFAGDESKRFKLVEAYDGERAELTLSLDVIYHLVEDDVFHDYMRRLFDAAERFVAIYSSDTDENPEDTAEHVRQCRFSQWVATHRPEWKLIRHVPNRYPYQGDSRTGTFADFFFYARG